MPELNVASLRLITIDDDVTVEVTYRVVFSAFEKELVGLGLQFRERIRVVGVDPAGGSANTVLHTFEDTIGRPLGDGIGMTDEPEVTLQRTRILTQPRSTFQEDAGGDSDEIRCEIELTPINMPATVSATSPQKVLLG